MTYGGIDMGLKLAVFRFLTEGIDEDKEFSVDTWKKPLPITLAGALTCWTRAPFEIAYKAFHADQKFPNELRRNYTSIRDAFW